MRTNLEKVLIFVAAVLLLSLIITICILAVSHGGKSTDEASYCETEECIQAAASMSSLLDSSVEPCDDFYQFSCGNYLETNRGTTVEEFAITKIYADMKRWLESGHTSAFSVYEKARTFYRACMEFRTSFKKAQTSLQKIVAENIEFWSSGNSEKSIFTNQNAALLSFGIPVAFKVEEIPGDEGSGKTVLRISPGEPFVSITVKDDVRGSEVLKFYIGSVFTLLGRRSTEAIAAAKDILDMEFHVMRYKLDVEQNCDMEDKRILTFEDLDRLSYKVNWIHLLTNHTGFDNVKDKVIVEVVCESYISGFISEITSYTTKEVNSYMTWRLVHKFVPYLFGESFHKQHMDHEITGVSSYGTGGFYEPVWKECVSLVEEYMPHVFATAYASKFYKKNTVDEVSNMMPQIASIASDLIDSSSWLSEKEKQTIIQKVSAVNYQLPYHNNLRKIIRIIDAAFSDLTLYDDDLVKNIMKATKFLLVKKLREPHFPFTEKTLPDSARLPEVEDYGNHTYSNIDVYYDKLQPPYLWDQTVSYLSYGRLGFYLSKELFKILSQPVKDLDGDDVRLFPEDPKANQNFEGNCPWNDDGDVNDPEKSVALLVQLSALKAAYMAFHETKGDMKKLPGLNSMSFDQMFFLSYAQTFCEPENTENADNANLTARQMVNGAVKQSETFAEAFSCASNSPMNPSKKCSLWK